MSDQDRESSLAAMSPSSRAAAEDAARQLAEAQAAAKTDERVTVQAAQEADQAARAADEMMAAARAMQDQANAKAAQ